MNSLANVLASQGKYKEAEAIHKQTLALREKVLSKEHPDILKNIYYLAYLLAKQDLYNNTTILYQKVYNSYSMVLGDNHPTTRACQRYYLEILQRKEQKGLIVLSEILLTILNNRKRASEDKNAGNQIYRRSRLLRGLAKLRIRVSKHDK
jgi:hypothetical protein